MSFFEKLNEEQHTLWVEKYRPWRLEDYVGNDSLKSKVSGYIQSGDIPHLLFYGKPGTGKTTLAKLITKSIESDVLMINASDENGVETLRVKIKNFASGVGFKPYKIVILDECLHEDTLVTVLREGIECKIAIKDLNDARDLVKSWNVVESKIQWRPFSLWDKGVQDVYEIELENGETVVCTPDHKWYVEGDNGKPIVITAKDLHKYNYILSPQ